LSIKGVDDMNILFMGTPRFAKNILKSLLMSEHKVIGVVTQPDKPVGRTKKPMASPVKILATEHQIPVFQPIHMKTDYQHLIDLKPDLIVTAAYGQMIPKALLDQVVAINVHGSLLPKYRGGAPIQYALFDGLEETGITIMYMAYKMDSGDIIKQASIKIDEHDNYETLSERLSILGSKLLLEVLEDHKKGIQPRTPQNESDVSFAFTLKRIDEYLDFHLTSDQIIQRLKGLSPEPGGYIIINNHTIKVFKIEKNDIMKHTSPGVVLKVSKQLVISTKDGAINILELLIPGKKKMNVKDFLNGQNIINIGDCVLRKDELHA
jgi:methionyl-tRNA formyltransferase